MIILLYIICILCKKQYTFSNLRSHVAKPASGDKSWRTSAKDYRFGQQESQVTINMVGDAQAATNLPKPKEQPKWMKESTVEGAIPEFPSQVTLSVKCFNRIGLVVML